MILIMIRVIVLYGVVVDLVHLYQEVKADQIAEDLHLKSMSHRLQTLISPSLQF